MAATYPYHSIDELIHRGVEAGERAITIASQGYAEKANAFAQIALAYAELAKAKVMSTK